MKKNDANMTLAGVAFIAASVSKFPTVEYGLYLLSVAFLIPVALTELRTGMLWLSGRIDSATEKLEKVNRNREDRIFAKQRKAGLSITRP